MGTEPAICRCCFEDIPFSADNPTLLCPKCGTENRLRVGTINPAPSISESPSFSAGLSGERVPMQSKQIIALIGAAVLCLGVFSPIVTIPLVGSMNYFRNGTGDGVVVLLFAALGAFAAIHGNVLVFATKPRNTNAA